ncbi:MAG: flippase-like domain-containing protein [Saprospiraceae bacterium]|nr:flippase-like domain-containing protein [Saprospiraceae bacterium]
MGIEKTIVIQEAFFRRRRLWVGLLKALLVGWLGYILYRQVVVEAGMSGLWRHLAGLWPEKMPWLLAAAVLMPVNWMLEAQKWRCLMMPFAPINKRQALRGIMAGVSFSQLTPNRVGEYGGRLAILPAGQYGAGVAATMVGSLAQWLALFSGGLAGLLYMARFDSPWRYAAFATAGILAVLTLVYFAGGRLAMALPSRLKKWRAPNALRQRLSFLAPYPQRILWRALVLAFARYSVYVAQYALLIRATNLDIPPDIIFSGIAAIYLFQTGIPVPPLAAVLTRGELALWLWESYNVDTLSILTASFALFIINLGVPALLGAAVIVKTKVLK